MVTKFTFGTPFDTEAVVKPVAAATGSLPSFLNITEDNKTITSSMEPDDIIYGLGEQMGGINKRGRIYVSNNTDDPSHHESRTSLYASHNFFIVDGNIKYGIFIDFPATVSFDMGFTDKDLIKIQIDEADYDLYVIEAQNTPDIISEFRELIGESYIAPKWAFGYQQSRWGYKSADDVRSVVKNYRANNLPLDAVYLDIDYMERYKDFTVSSEAFPDFDSFVKEMQDEHIHIVPIIDAGVKIEDGYDVYEEGVKHDYFCKDENGKDFVAAVWPGRVHLPDFLNKDARHWFGSKYKFLLDKGIDGFWNDMNEPALFYSDKSLKNAFAELKKYDPENMNLYSLWDFQGLVGGLANNPADYRSFYHNIDGKPVRHDKVHNLYGFNMTRAASEAFKELVPDKNILMFSRSSYIGMHRYGGIWTGDNCSWWAHIELLMHMLPGLNMCGFIYCGADTGGFGGDASEELMMRFTELSMFTPLMRNHSSLGTREQELYRFKDTDSFRGLLKVRYGLIPYLYSEYIKAVKNNSLMFVPMGIAFPDDKKARHIEDQLMVGESIMIAPVYKPNCVGRYVYLPEDMTLIRFRSLTDRDIVTMAAGHHYFDCKANEVLVFIRKGHILPMGGDASCISEVSTGNFTIYGNHGASYELFTDENNSEIIQF